MLLSITAMCSAHHCCCCCCCFAATTFNFKSCIKKLIGYKQTTIDSCTKAQPSYLFLKTRNTDTRQETQRKWFINPLKPSRTAVIQKIVHQLQQHNTVCHLPSQLCVQPVAGFMPAIACCCCCICTRPSVVSHHYCSCCCC